MELDSLADAHYNRYKQTWPTDIAPSDMFVPRLFKKITKRLLTVVAVFKVRNQQQERKSVKKRTKVGDGIEVMLDGGRRRG